MPRARRTAVPASTTVEVGGNSETAAELAMPAAAPRKWSAEDPYLYQMLLTVKGPGGNVLEVIPQNVGFRRVEINGGRFLINGTRHPHQGREPPRAQRRDRQSSCPWNP